MSLQRLILLGLDQIVDTINQWEVSIMSIDQWEGSIDQWEGSINQWEASIDQWEASIE